MENKKEKTFKERLEEIRKINYLDQSDTNFTVLVSGLPGSGKTSFIATGRRPILVDMFDPRGSIILEKGIKEGWIVVRKFWNELSSRPTEYQRWYRMWEDDIKTGFLNNFGTYAIDSLTTLIHALSNEIGRRKGREPGTLAVQDYQPLYATVRDIIKLTSTQNVDFILTAHLVNSEDDVTGEVVTELDTYKRLRSQIPLLFTEKYVLMVKATSSGAERILLTDYYRRFRASTQLGANGKFAREEVPNIKELLKKAGYPTEDKPY